MTALQHGPCKLLLMGAGASNLHIANTLARNINSNLEITCIASDDQVLHPSMLAGLVAGRHHFSDCCLPFQDVFKRCQVQWIQSKVQAISAANKSIQLEDGSTHDFDLLSINTTPLQHREQIERQLPGAKKYGFFVYPMHLFAEQWAQVCAEGYQRALRIAIIGSGLRSMELALAVRQRLPSAAVTLVASQAAAPSGAALRLQRALKEQRITVLNDNALSCSATHVQLGCGAMLACDVPIIALEPQAPGWLTEAHAHIFYHSVASLNDCAGLYAAVGQANVGCNTATSPLQMFYAGSSHAVAQWGEHSAQGRAVGWLKDWRDRRACNFSL